MFKVMFRGLPIAVLPGLHVAALAVMMLIVSMVGIVPGKEFRRRLLEVFVELDVHRFGRLVC